MALITKEKLTELVWQYYRQHKRDLPWRRPDKNGRFDPYHILVSEYMLQQTQVRRVESKYQEFLRLFPSISVLAEAPLSQVMAAWSGLGYNRRPKYLHEAAALLVAQHKSQVPKDAEALKGLPGIGKNTAGAICAYAFNEPCIFIETNIRTVFLYYFFTSPDNVHDKEILTLVEATLPAHNIREWYWALMDYGAYLKTVSPNLSHQSYHYRRQSPFEGSLRQLRGHVLRLLLHHPYSLAKLKVDIQDERLETALQALKNEGLITSSGGLYRVP